MERASSPRLPGASLTVNKDGIEIPIGVKARNRGQDHLDDSSSVMSGTSLGSSNKRRNCHVCGDPEGPYHLFVKCTKCRRTLHRRCHKPDIDPKQVIPPGFICGTCDESMTCLQNLDGKVPNSGVSAKAAAVKGSDQASNARSSPATSSRDPSVSKATSLKEQLQDNPAPQNEPSTVKRSTPHSWIASALPQAATKSGTPLSTATFSKDTASSSGVRPSGERLLKKPAGEAESTTITDSMSKCQVPGCGGIPFISTNAVPLLCYKHRLEQRTKDVQARPPPPKTAPISRPFNKAKLYPARPDDKPFINKALKRKRTELPKKPPVSNDQSMRPKKQALPKSAERPTNTTLTFDAPIPMSNRPVPETRAGFSFTAPARGTDSHDRNHSLGSTSMIESIFDEELTVSSSRFPPSDHAVAKGDTTNDTETPKSTRRSLIMPAESPEYEPPPPKMSHVGTWADEDQDEDEGNSPGSQIAEELRANAEQHHPGDVGVCPPQLPALSPVEEQTNGADSLMGLEDENFLGADAYINGLASEHLSSPENGRQQAAESTEPPVLSPELPSDHGLDYDTDMNNGAHDARPEIEEEDVFTIPTNRPLTALEKRMMLRAPFEESELDSYLEKQRYWNEDDIPTKAELDAQNWGYIDPRHVWPQRMTDEEREAKIKQIKARGGRKANFGKLFTAQNLQEKAEKGWESHQWQERRDDDATKELVRRMEELFQVENLANMVPATRNGRLVMMEREEPDEEPRGPGRRKKKNAPRVFTVTGAPNPI